MSWGIKGTDTVSVVRKILGPVDVYGNYTETNVVIPINGCLVEYGVSEISEQLFRDTSKINLVVHFPVGTTISALDEFTYLGEEYRLSQEPIVRSRMVGSPIPKKVIVGLERING